MSDQRVLVTGGSGFIGAHCILQLLAADYQVCTTVRSLKRESDVRAMLKVGGVDPGERLTFVEADLNRDDGWADAADGCQYVLHVATPFPMTPPRNEDELIIPAVEGTLRVLRAARDAGVRRVVVTSSFAAIAYGHPPTDQPYTEESWTNLNDSVRAYQKSKVLAERAAWDFMAQEGAPMELAVVNPVGVFGPVLGPDFSNSILMVQGLLAGRLPAAPLSAYSIVDVRDVADLHLRAMTRPEASGERFIAASGEPMTMHDVALVLRERMGDAARRVPSRAMPDWMLRLLALFVPPARQLLSTLGVPRRASAEKARRLLDWNPRSPEDALVATAESLIRLELV